MKSTSFTTVYIANFTHMTSNARLDLQFDVEEPIELLRADISTQFIWKFDDSEIVHHGSIKEGILRRFDGADS